MITIKTPEEIEILKAAGARLAHILHTTATFVKPGVTTKELNDIAHKLTVEGGDVPSFLDYTPDGADRPYPAALCVSVNDEVVHGIPNEEEKILQEGDIVALDMGLIHKDLFVDSAITVPVGKIERRYEELLRVTKMALQTGIDAARGGRHVGDIGYAIENYTKQFPYAHAEGLAGHGVGYAVHELPFVPNEGRKGTGAVLRPGMVLAIEPMLNMGTGKVRLGKDGYTYLTKDGKRSAHFEHTIVITDGDPIVVTRYKSKE